MKVYQIALAAVTAVVVGFDTVSQSIRRWFSGREEILALANNMSHGQNEQPACATPMPERQDITDNLLKFFELSSVSRNILHILADGQARLSHSELSMMVNDSLVRTGKLPLSEQAIRARVMNLMGASLAQLRNGALSVTPAGLELVSRLASPQESLSRS